MFIESIDQYAHPVVPELDTSIVKRGGEQRLGGMEGEAWRELNECYVIL